MSKNRLIYVWFKEFGDGFVQNQGITLIREYIIETEILQENSEMVTVRVKVVKNPEYFCPPNFYGKNICGLTAVVGENGSGKTTFARMLVNQPIPGIVERYPFFFLEINEDDNISIYLYNVDVDVKSELQYEKYRIEGNYYTNVIYLSNMFNFVELTDDNELNELGVSGTWKRQIYTPAYLLKHSREKAKKRRYGYFNEKRNEFLQAIYSYADYVENSEINAYIKKQEELSILCFKRSSEELRKELDIFQRYKIKIQGINEYIIEIAKEDKRKELLNAYKNWCIMALKEKENSLWANIYMLCVSEICFARHGWGENFINEITGISPMPKLQVIEQLERMLVEIESPWKLQIINCLEELKKQCIGINRNWKLGIHKFEESEDIVDWYYEELKKPDSFFKRNLYFELQPSSTGELAMSNLFSYIVDAIFENPKEKSFLLIIDEIDVGLHPRWQQRIIQYLLRWLESFEGYYFQIIIMSHSPIVLSDVLKEHVVILKKNQQKLFTVEETKKPTFGANIAMQFLDSFYMDEGNIGEFSKAKIKTIIDVISKESDMWERQILLYLIDSIGEEMVRKKLHHDIWKKHSKTEKDLIEQWKKCNNRQKEEILHFIDKLNTEN